MRNPFQEFQVALRAVRNSFPEGLQSLDGGSPCEIIETYFAASYTQNDSWCYWNQLVRGQTCGCPDNSEIKALVWTQRSSAILSLSGSLLISMSIIKKPRNVRWSPYNQNRPEYLRLRLVELYCLHHWHFVRSEGAWLVWIDWKQCYMWLSSLAIPNWHRIRLL